MAFIYDLSDTWNNGSTTFTSIKMDVTDTASAAASELIALQVGGTDKFTVRKDGQGYFAGNLGVGTSSPARSLDVAGLARFNSSGNYMEFNTNRLTSEDASGANIRAAISSASAPTYSVTGDTNTGAFFPAADTFAFSTGGTERMRLTSTGLGIGTTSPSEKLSVYEATTSSSAIPAVNLSALAGSTNDRLPAINWSYGPSGTPVFASLDANRASSVGGNLLFHTATTAGTLTERMRLDSSGNVGIGTSAPATITSGITALSISDAGAKTTGDKIGEINFVTNDGSFTGTFSDGIGAAINAVSTSATGAAYALAFTTATTSGSNRAERCRILHSGGFLVGKTADNTTDDGHVLGDGGYLYSTRNGNICHVLNRKGTEGDIVQYRNDNVTVGSVSIAASSTSYNTSSDARLKHDIVDAPEASDLIDGIQVRSFKWNIDNSEQRYGMVAQELVEVAPEAVTGEPDSDEMMAVDYSKLVPMLVKEVQSLRKRVAELEGK